MASIHTPTYDGLSESGEWSRPSKGSFDTDDLGEIAQHFIVSMSGFPPDTYGDLKLPVVDTEGNLRWGALDSAWKTAASTDGLSDDQVETVKTKVNNLAKEHFDHDFTKVERDFGKVATFKGIDEDKRLATGVVLVPSEVDHQGDWVEPETIEGFSRDFMRRMQTGDETHRGGGLMHAAFPGPTEISLFENRVLDKETTIEGEEYPAGTWVQTWHIEDDDLWELVKDGVISGYSIGGRVRDGMAVEYSDLPDHVTVPDAVTIDKGDGDGEPDLLRRVDGGRINEVSFVDMPAVPRAQIRSTKAADDHLLKANPDLTVGQQVCEDVMVDRGHDKEDAKRACRVIQRFSGDDPGDDEPDGDGPADQDTEAGEAQYSDSKQRPDEGATESTEGVSDPSDGDTGGETSSDTDSEPGIVSRFKSRLFGGGPAEQSSEKDAETGQDEIKSVLKTMTDNSDYDADDLIERMDSLVESNKELSESVSEIADAGDGEGETEEAGKAGEGGESDEPDFEPADADDVAELNQKVDTIAEAIVSLDEKFESAPDAGEEAGDGETGEEKDADGEGEGESDQDLEQKVDELQSELEEIHSQRGTSKQGDPGQTEGGDSMGERTAVKLGL